MSHRFVAIFSILLFHSLSHAEEMNSPDMLQLLEADMQEYSGIATRTRQNVDYMPYIISAWNSDELLQMGVSTLRDALSLVPGVDLSIGTVGTTIPIFRGSNPFAMGQSKLVIDGVVINDKMTGGYNQYMDMPVAMIQRIEIVRGPGSLLSYVNGYAGSIHIITKANRDDGLPPGNEVYAELGSSEYKTGGFVAAHTENGINISTDFYYKTHDQILPVSVDRYGSSGDSQQWLDHYSLGINAQYDNLSVKSRLHDRESGASYGQSFSLSEDPSDYVIIRNSFLEFAYSHELAKNISAEFSLGYIELTRQLQNKVIPDGGTMGATVLPDGMYFLVDMDEQTFFEKINLQLNNLNAHQINLGVYAYQSDVGKKQRQTSTDDMQTFVTSDLLIDAPRDMVSFYFDDLVDLTEQTSIQVGAKYDHYSDVENQFSPRLALVHRYDNENIYKFMYTHSYREPAWREQYLAAQAFYSSTLDVKPELVDAYELGYVRKFDLNSHFKFNAYYLSNKDQIHAQNPSHTFQNNGDNNLYGYEVEYKRVFLNDDELYLNFSYVDGGNVENILASSAKQMSKVYYVHAINEALTVSAIAQYVDEKSRIEADLRNGVDAYMLFDLSLNYQHKPADININVSIKNLTDETYYLPSPENTYPDDFQQPGRSILFSLRKGF